MRASVLAFALLVPGCRAVSNDANVPGERPPNLVLFLADDQGWGELATQGHPYVRTPTLDAMAAGGLTLARFYAAAPVCSPTRASVLTGRHPNRMGCFAWGYEVPSEETTIAEVLRARGYATGHFGKWHVGGLGASSPTSPGAQGFDAWVSSPNYYDLDPEFSDRGTVIRDEGEGSHATVEHALAFIVEAHAAGRPFLAVVWFGSPHWPHAALDADLAALPASVPDEMRAYVAEIEALDAAVGRVRDELRRLGIERETLVWFTSDNGPKPPDESSSATGGLRGFKKTLWEGGLRVPSLLEWPGRIARGSRSSAPTGTVDVLPTVAALAGAEARIDAPLDGESFAALLDGEPWTRTKPLGFWFHEAPGRAMHSDRFLAAVARGEDPLTPPPTNDEARRAFASGEQTGDSAWIDGDWKLHRIDAEGGPRYELYDLRRDPNEERDLAAEESERVDAMARALERWRSDVAADFLDG